MLKIILVCVVAGLLAGLGTGFAGLSAACFITPMLVSFLDVPTYEAVGIALASDVLASAVSAYTYKRAGNIDIKKGRTLMVAVIGFAIIGSAIAFFLCVTDLGNDALGYFSIISAFFLGLNFIIHPRTPKPGPKMQKYQGSALLSVIAGIFIGLNCGFQGTGGGMMMLFALVVCLGFDMKKAVGTSVFIMTFTALIGALTHFIMYGEPTYLYLILCIISTLVFARIGSVIANRLSEKTSYLTVGFLLAFSAVIMLVVKIWL